jgi:uncharacterized protein (DUF433 family)
MHIDRITIIPDVCGGEPTIPRDADHRQRSAGNACRGMTAEEILRDYPYLERPTSMLAFNMPLITPRIVRSH